MTGQGFVATYFDGVTAARRQVVVNRAGPTLHINDPDTGRIVDRWAVDRLVEHREERQTGVLVFGPRDADARLQVTGDGIIRDMRGLLPDLAGEGLPWPMIRKVGLFSVAALGSVVVLLFVIMPALAGQLARIIPPEREVAFGESVQRQIERIFGAETTGELLCTGPEGQVALAEMTDRVMGDTAIAYPLTVSVFDDGLVNAFALPGGHVVIFRGLIEAAEDPDEVAAVLAHEIGHVVARDPTRIALQTAGSAGLLGLVLGDFAGGTIALALANQFISASYSQEAETAADTFAHGQLLAAGLPPEALARMFERLREEYGDVDGIAANFISHPRLADRIDAARTADTPRGGPPSLDADGWAALRAICGD
ncbi:MAG: M48 family metallopeptidase [Paracoccaceae bacterium]|nr:M48 family metallopeptidase [Paracoccaceae bacterium]